jgi:hypothetical protein
VCHLAARFKILGESKEVFSLPGGFARGLFLRLGGSERVIKLDDGVRQTPRGDFELSLCDGGGRRNSAIVSDFRDSD